MPEPSGTLSAVIVSGGKQYRVAAGDRVLVDRVAAEPGAELVLDHVLMATDGKTVDVMPNDLDGVVVRALVLAHQRGPKVDVIRYKAKKRVRVRRGSRAELTALEILTVGAPRESKKGSSRSRSRPRKKQAEPAKEG